MIALHNSTWASQLVTERKLPRWGSETGIDDVQLESSLYEVLPGDTSVTVSAVSAAIITSVHNFPGPEFNLHENCPSKQAADQSEGGCLLFSQSEACTHHLRADTSDATDINKGRHRSEHLVSAKVHIIRHIL